MEKRREEKKKDGGLKALFSRWFGTTSPAPERQEMPEAAEPELPKTEVSEAPEAAEPEEEVFQIPEAFDRNHIWVFNAGNTYTGNPKWLFEYVNRYRKDIFAVWLTNREETIDLIRGLGYLAWTYNCDEGLLVQSQAGVYVVEQVKEKIPALMKSVKMLNLFHGVGCKSIERKVDYGFLMERIAKKYIQNNSFYRNNQLFLVTSPLMEAHFKEQCGIDDDKVIRAGYPRCLYQQRYERVQTFDHDIRRLKGMDASAKMVAYVPTYRDGSKENFFSQAIPDMDALIQVLERENILLIFKVHPQMEKDYQYIQMEEYYRECPHLLFWDNNLDFYEIMDQIDTAIIDYSSIFYDLMAAGVKNFVRYIFDYGQEGSIRELVFDFKEMTCGRICMDFSELLAALSSSGAEDDGEKAQRERLHDLFWQYADEGSMERIVEETLAFCPQSGRKFPTLYSFDLFDTVFARRVLDPKGIFFGVQERMRDAGGYPSHFVESYPELRMAAEENVRYFYKRTMALRSDERREITFTEIFDRLGDLYGLSEGLKNQLMQWEEEAEYEDCIPLPGMIGYIEHLLEAGEQVAFISDMYLPEAFIRRLLKKNGAAPGKCAAFSVEQLRCAEDYPETVSSSVSELR